MLRQIHEAIGTVHNAFIPVERQKMRNALKYGKANGWISSEPRAPRFPWADHDLAHGHDKEVISDIKALFNSSIFMGSQ